MQCIDLPRITCYCIPLCLASNLKTRTKKLCGRWCDVLLASLGGWNGVFSLQSIYSRTSHLHFTVQEQGALHHCCMTDLCFNSVVLICLQFILQDSSFGLSWFKVTLVHTKILLNVVATLYIKWLRSYIDLINLVSHRMCL